jgi:hypothetical protein
MHRVGKGGGAPAAEWAFVAAALVLALALGPARAATNAGPVAALAEAYAAVLAQGYKDAGSSFRGTTRRSFSFTGCVAAPTLAASGCP